VPWTQDELFSYLRKGFSVAHGSAAGPMGRWCMVFPRFRTEANNNSVRATFHDGKPLSME
jgi:hypothetical protein